MKRVLTYEFDADESYAFETVCKAYEYRRELDEIYMLARNVLKYGSSDDYASTLELIKQSAAICLESTLDVRIDKGE